LWYNIIINRDFHGNSFKEGFKMKILTARILSLFGIALLVAAMVFLFASCDNDLDSGGDSRDSVKILGSGTHGDFQYNYTASTIIITGYTGSGGDVSIPKTIKGKPVTAIRDGSYFTGVFYKKQLTSVTIPDSVISIGAWAFLGDLLESGSITHNQLTNVLIPDSVTSIGEGAFAANPLTSITIGNNVTSIEEYAFGYTQLTNVIIPDSVIYLNGFNGNPLLTNVTIGNNVISIGIQAFYQSNLTSVTIPGSVTFIEKYAFVYNQLTSITIGANVTFDDEEQSFDDDFDYKYDHYGKVAGTYTLIGTSWEKVN